MATFHTFASSQEARDYRHTNGTGGWIFVDDETNAAILFPPEMPPSVIFRHPLTAGKSGNLIGHG